MSVRGAARPGRVLARALIVCILPAMAVLAAVALRRAQGPFWLAANQDPAYSYLYDSLRVAQGLPPNHVQHPGTAIQLLGAATLQATTPGRGVVLQRRVLADPETALRSIHAVLLAACALGMAALGASVLAGTGKPMLAWLAQAGVLIVPGLVGELAGVKPEPFLLALALAMAAVIASPDGRVRASIVPFALGIASGLALAAKFTAFPLAVAALVALQGVGPRLRFAGAAALSFLIGVLPALRQLSASIEFVRRSVTGAGMYGTGMFAADYGPALRSALAEAAPVIIVTAVSLAAAFGRRARSGDRRLLLALASAELVGLAVLVRQPYGGTRYLVPEGGLLGLNLVVLARLYASDARAGLRRGPALLFGCAVLALGSREVRGLIAYASGRARDVRDQEAAAGAASGLQRCAVVEYHKCSSVPSALLFGYGRPPVDGGHLEMLQQLHPAALFLDYVRDAGGAAPSDFRFLPYESWTHPRFRNFRGGLPLATVLQGRSCVAFHGSTGGPGRLFLSPDFARESVPIPGRVEPVYESPSESVYEVELGTGLSAGPP